MDASTLVPYILGISFATTTVSIAVSCCAIYRVNKYRALIDEVKLYQELSDNKFSQVTQSLTPMGERILELESKVSGFSEKLNSVQNLFQKSKEMGQGHYHQARKMVELGGDETTLIQDCGLTKIEAQMIRLLQAKKASLSKS